VVNVIESEFIPRSADPVPVPQTISGLVLWLDAGAITGLSDGDPVGVWPDSSDNGNNATQAGVNRPTFRTSIINGKPVVRFDGLASPNGDYFADIFTISSQYMTIYAVFSHDHSGSVQPSASVWQTANVSTSGFFPRWTDNHHYLNYGAGWININPSDFTQNTWYSSIAVYQTGRTELWRNGVLNDFINLNSVSTGGFRIGYRSNDNTYFKGDIAEIIFYDRALDNTERQTVEVYLEDKYGL